MEALACGDVARVFISTHIDLLRLESERVAICYAYGMLRFDQATGGVMHRFLHGRPLFVRPIAGTCP